MKNKLHLIVSIFCAFMLFVTLNSFQGKAQITITEADLPNIWTVIVEAIDTTPNVSLLSQVAISGANQTWNLTAIQNESQDTTEFMDPAGTPFASYFPNANLSGLNYEDTIPTYFYAIKTSSYFDIIGFASPYEPNLGDTIIIPFSDPQTMFEMPATYQTHFTDTASFMFQFFIGQMGIDTFRMREVIFIDNIADGWGTLTTSTGTYNVIRISEQEITVDSNWAYITGSGWMANFFGPPTIDTSYNYSWLANGQDYSVAEITLNATQDTVTDASYLFFTNANVPEIYSENNLFNLYPNPANEYIYINSKTTALFELYDVQGRIVKTIKINDIKMPVYIQDLNKGLYLYRTLDKQGRELNKGKVVIE